MNCWKCRAEAGTGAQCAACGALQPVPPGADGFALLGLPRTFFLEPAVVEEKFKQLNRQLHPDRFAQQAPRERRLSLEWTTAVNGAVRALRDPVRRASYLLKLEGVDVDREAGGGGAGAAPAVPMEFLEEMMEQREALAAARRSRSPKAIGALAAAMRQKAEHALAELAGQLRGWEEQGRDRSCLAAASRTLAALRYYQRFQEEAEAAELDLLEQP